MVGISLTLALLVITSAVAAIGWAGGIWALVGPAVTGRPVTVKDSYRYGLRHLPSLGPWTLGATLLLVAGLSAYVVPGLYLLYALSMFSFPVLFEHGTNPLRRSFRLTHTQAGRVLARWSVLAVVAVAFEGALSLLFGGLSLALLGHPGFGSSAQGLNDGLLDAVHTAVGAPLWALLVIGLTVTYMDLQASPTRNSRS
ncbi:hypothetical protein CTZ28_03635 [Streptomyces shenzhenensis]|uniref:Uncharacterized protein n=1 Tax=Streptomyces shenzhenensis TaxID=943815 RepID=A0A3M0IXM8_9ACTN|nr:hypothetical protein CTZ28_03635 [Streptomyces shenzhenensis]